MKNFKPPSFITILILTAITVVFWIFFGVVRIFTKADEETVPAAILAPLSPTLDKDVLDKLPSRVYFDDSQISTNVVSSPTPTPSIQIPTPTEILEATESATPTATEGATIDEE